MNNTDTPWVYEKNLNNRFCGTPIPEGKYTYSANPVKGENNIVPTGYCYFKNGYTGTASIIRGGTLELKNTTLTFDLVLGNGNTVKGTFNSSHYYARGYSNSLFADSLEKIDKIKGHYTVVSAVQDASLTPDAMPDYFGIKDNGRF